MNTIQLKRIRKNDVLGNLSPQQRDQLDQWILDGRTYAEIIADLAKPPPVGCAVKTSPAALSRYRNERLLAIQLADADQVSAGLPHPQTSLKNLLNQSALTAALQVELPPSIFQNLARYYRTLSNETFRQRLTEQRDLQIQLARDRHNLETFKAQYIAAREALNHVAELTAIWHNQTLDDPAKIELARNHLFGLAAIPAPAPSNLLPPKCPQPIS